MKPIVGYRKTYTHRLDGKWDWSCPVWFDNGIFASAMITSSQYFETKREAIKNMKDSLKLFGITNKTPVVD